MAKFTLLQCSDDDEPEPDKDDFDERQLEERETPNTWTILITMVLDFWAIVSYNGSAKPHTKLTQPHTYLTHTSHKMKDEKKGLSGKRDNQTGRPPLPDDIKRVKVGLRLNRKLKPFLKK